MNRVQKARVSVSVSLRWWLRPYLAVVHAWASAFDMEPDMSKVKRMIRHGVVVRTRRA